MEKNLLIIIFVTILGGILFGLETGTISAVMMQLRHVFVS
jgi:hypothetical protein